LAKEQLNELQGVYQRCDERATKIRYQAVQLYCSDYASEEMTVITSWSQRRLPAWCRHYRVYEEAGLIERQEDGNSAVTASFGTHSGGGVVDIGISLKADPDDVLK
jgi:hypothetical protein